MNTCKLHIVALPYYEAGECLGEFLAEANGRAMTLRPEPTNEYDPQAIRAYDWQGRHIGYVASHDILDAWRVFRGSVIMGSVLLIIFYVENLDVRE